MLGGYVLPSSQVHHALSVMACRSRDNEKERSGKRGLPCKVTAVHNAYHSVWFVIADID